MNIQSQNKVYESFDIISQEMARKLVQENRHKLSGGDNLEFFKSVSPIEDNEKNALNNPERNKQKKWTMTTKNIFTSHRKHKTANNPNKNTSKKNVLINMQISSIKQDEEKKDEKNSSFKKNLINNIFGNTNSNEVKNINPSTNPKEKNILILKSEETSKSLSENNDNSSITDNPKEKSIIKENNLIIIEKNENENNENKKKEFSVFPRRKSVQLSTHFSPKNNYNHRDKIEEQSFSSSSSKKSKSNKKNTKNNSSEKIDEKLNSNDLLKELSLDELTEEKPVSKHSTNMHKKQKKKYGSRNFNISPFVEPDGEMFSKKKNETLIELQKKSLKNVIIYKPKWTPKHFYEHEMFLQKRKERINYSKKIKQLETEERNYTSIPTINPLSIEIINQTETYIPIMKRSIEYKNQKLYKNIINEKIKEREIKEMMKSNNLYVLNKSESDVLYWRQKLWQKKIEQKLNKSSYKLQKLKEKEEEKKYIKYKLQLCSHSKKMVENNIKYFHTINNDDGYILSVKKKSNIFERLYQDSKSHEKRIKELTKSYFNKLFRPNINHNFILTKKNNNNKSQKIFNTIIYPKKKKRKINIIKNTKKNKKKTFSLIFEDLTEQKNKSRNKKIQNENMTSIDSTKPSKSTTNTIKQRLSYEFNNIKNINTRMSSITKEINNKLGEIKEADSVLSEASAKRNIEENKNIEEINKINNNTSNTNNISQNKSSSNDTNNINNNQQTKNSINKEKEDNSIKEQSSNHEKAESQPINTQQVNDSNNINIKRKSSTKVRPSNFRNLLKENDTKKNVSNNLIKKESNKDIKEIKVEVSFVQEPNDLNNNENNSPSFNSLIKKDNNNLDNLVANNNSENILKESGSFGNYNYSNFISKDNISKEKKEKDLKRQKSMKNKKPEGNNKNIKDNNNDIIPQKSVKKITNINFDPYEIQKSEDSISSEETSSKKEEDDIIQKIRNIEIKEERNKIDKIREGKKNKNKYDESQKEFEFYKLNWRSNAANAIQEPFIYKDTKGIFYNFFKKDNI